MSFIQMTFFSS